jgi:hypothetical protein
MNTVTVDFTRLEGPVKPLHGVNTSPVRYNTKLPELKDAGIPFVRLHDAGGAFGGTYLVDVPNLFPNFDADPQDPASYEFAYTDAYFRTLDASGMKIFYRLGVTIENFWRVKAYRLDPPKDFGKWARICEHIIRHYNEGWADGFHWNLRYWEVWCEPENPPLWQGTREQFFELYRVAANHLKRCFPDLHIGGYGGCGFYAIDPEIDRDRSDFYRSFVTWFEDFCAYITDEKTSAPLDFYSWHLYGSEPERIMRHAAYVRKVLDKAGLTATESIFDEWNYMAKSEKYDRPVFDNMKEAPGAAYCAAAFALMQAGPVDKAMYYDALPTRAYCGLFYFPSHRTTPCYEAFVAFNTLYGLGGAVACESSAEHVYAVAAANGGRQAFLLSNYSWEKDMKPRRIRLAIEGGAPSYELYIVDEEHAHLTHVGACRNGDELELPEYATVLALAGVELPGAVEPVDRPVGALNGLAPR